MAKKSKTDAGRESQYASVFISYGGPDERYARALQEALEEKGIDCFVFYRDALPGKSLHDVMRHAVNGHDRVVMICSKRALNRLGVLNELEEVLRREAREGGMGILIPLTIDNYVFRWKPANELIAQSVRDRVIADFRKAPLGSSEFNEALSRLVEALRYDT